MRVEQLHRRASSNGNHPVTSHHWRLTRDRYRTVLIFLHDTVRQTVLSNVRSTSSTMIHSSTMYQQVITHPCAKHLNQLWLSVPNRINHRHRFVVGLSQLTVDTPFVVVEEETNGRRCVFANSDVHHSRNETLDKQAVALSDSLRNFR